MSCEFTPTVTISLSQYEGLLRYKEYYENELAEHIQTKLDFQEASKARDEYKMELDEIKRWKEKWDERQHGD